MTPPLLLLLLLLAALCLGVPTLMGQTLTLAAPRRVEFAHPISLTATLTNRTGMPLEVFAPAADAALRWRLDSRLDQPPGEKSSKRETSTGGPYGYRSGAGGLHRFTTRPRAKVTLAPGESLSGTWRVDLLFEQPMLHGGAYRIRVTYEDEVTAEAETRVEFEPRRDMPRLIRLLAQGDRMARLLARGYVRMLTGGRLLKDFDGATDADFARAAQAVAEWWKRSGGTLPAASHHP